MDIRKPERMSLVDSNAMSGWTSPFGSLDPPRTPDHSARYKA